MGRRAGQEARPLSGSRRPVLAPGTPRLPGDHRHQGAEHARQRARKRRRTARDDQHADRIGQDPRRRAGDRRGYARRRLPRRGPLGRGPRRTVRTGGRGMAASMVEHRRRDSAASHLQDVGRTAETATEQTTSMSLSRQSRRSTPNSRTSPTGMVF